MGEVKNDVKGATPARKQAGPSAADAGIKGKNILEQVRDLESELSRLTAVKDEEVLSEGEAARAENTRKAALLRAAHSLLTAVSTLLEEY